jgi:hypothetical protein
MLVFVTACALALSVFTTLGLELGVGFWGLASSCGFVLLLAVVVMLLDRAVSRLPDWSSFIFIPILYGALGLAFFLFGEAIDQPHPDGGWLARGAASSVQFITPIMAVMVVLVTIDGALQPSRPRDRGYYPRLASVWRGLGSPHVRLILIIGGLFVIGWYAQSVIAVWSANQSHCGWVWPPKRIFAACQLLWGLLWLADSASRPHCGTMIAAVGYLCATLLFGPPGGVLRE